MKKIALVASSLCLAALLVTLSQASGAPPQFTFVSWGDTKDGLDVFAAQSKQITAMNPALTVYCGDLVGSYGIDNLKRWKRTLNGEQDEGLFSRTFAVRGNHDQGDVAGWRGFFAFRDAAASIGATNYRVLAEAMTYSFDYANSHFVAVDVLGDVTLMTRKQIAWVDADLTAAEQRGLAHAFIFWHGPLYPVGGHCCSAKKDEFVVMANRHPIVSATFHGHEHQMAWVHIDGDRYRRATHEFEEFVTGSSGAGTKDCKPGRSDYCRKAAGFATVDVSGSDFTVSFFLDGDASPAWTRTFTNTQR